MTEETNRISIGAWSDYLNPSSISIVVRKLIIDEAGKIKKYGLTNDGGWVYVAEGLGYPRECIFDIIATSRLPDVDGCIVAHKTDDGIRYEWEGGNIVELSYEFIVELDIVTINGNEINVGPYRLNVIGHRFERDTIIAERMDK